MSVLYVPYDILYHIYFMIDDYQTILKFNILNKVFYGNYIRRYNKSYKHKFSILFKDVFKFLALLPNLKPNDDDIHIFMNIQNMCIEPTLKSIISSDIIFIYRLYKCIIYDNFKKKIGCNSSLNLANLILIQGPTHIVNNTIVTFNKNQVKLIISKDNNILELNVAMNFLYLRSQFLMFDNVIN